MDTNRSKYTEEDLIELRKDIDPYISPKQARRENHDLRKKIARRTRRLEKREFEKRIDEDLLDDIEDFWRR